MKNIESFVLEKLKIDKNINVDTDEWLLINAPAWSNYDSSDNRKFRELFDDRVFELESRDSITGGIWMDVVLVKLSDIPSIMDIYGWKKKPIAFELPEYLPINASKKEIKKFIDHPKWNYKELKKYQYKD